jgi:hypothetical protein
MALLAELGSTGPPRVTFLLVTTEPADATVTAGWSYLASGTLTFNPGKTSRSVVV